MARDSLSVLPLVMLPSARKAPPGKRWRYSTNPTTPSFSVRMGAMVASLSGAIAQNTGSRAIAPSSPSTPSTGTSSPVLRRTSISGCRK